MPTLTDYLLEANLFTIIIVKVGMMWVAFAMVDSFPYTLETNIHPFANTL